MRLLDGIQSALNPQGADAALIAEMSWVLFAGAALIFAGVMALAAWAVFGARERTARLSPRLLVVGGGIVFPAVTLLALLVYSLARAASLHPVEGEALRIEVVGEQWWVPVEQKRESRDAAPSAARGMEAINQYACVTCHEIPGIVGANAPVGAPLKGIGSRVMLGGVLPNSPDNMVLWLRAPQKLAPRTAMPDLRVTERDARDIAAYLATLK